MSGLPDMSTRYMYLPSPIAAEPRFLGPRERKY